MSTLQAILFPRSMTARESENWLRKHGLAYRSYRLTNNFRRYRLKEPSNGNEYRTLTLDHDRGIKAVVQFAKRS